MGLRPGAILWVLFAAFIVYGTTIPFDFVRQMSSVEQKLEGLARDPLSPPGTPQDWSTPDLAQNFLLFVPFGFLGVIAAAPNARSGLYRLALVTALGMTLGLGVEALQLFTHNRTSSLTDVITNTVGTGCGAVVANSLRTRFRDAVNRMIADGWFNTRSFYPMVLATVAVCVLAWAPFDVTLDVSSIVPKVRLLAVDVWQYAGITGEGVAFIQFMALAITLSAWLSERGRARPATTAAVVAVGMAIGLEASQILITSRMPGLADTTVRAGSAIVGAFLWSFSRDTRRPGLWMFLLAVATLVAVFVHRSSTSEILAPQRLYRLLAFYSYEGTSVPAFAHLTEQFLLFASAAFAFAQTIGTTPARTIGAAIALAVLVAASTSGVHLLSSQEPGAAMSLATSVAGAATGAYAATDGARIFRSTLTSWQDLRLSRQW